MKNYTKVVLEYILIGYKKIHFRIYNNSRDKKEGVRMKNRRRTKLKSAYIFCIAVILALGLTGGSYANWTDSNFLLNRINTGRLETDLITENFYTIIIQEIQTPVYEDGIDDKGNKTKIFKGYNIETSNNYFGKIPFIIENTSTLPIGLEQEEIFLAANGDIVDVSSICSIEYRESFGGYCDSLDSNFIMNDIYGYLSIDVDSEQIKDFMQRNTQSTLEVNLYFRQSNLLYGGWTSDVNISIPIIKEVIVLEDKDSEIQEPETQDENLNEVESEEVFLEEGADNED